jgi:hypothetical protein
VLDQLNVQACVVSQQGVALQGSTAQLRYCDTYSTW